MKMNVYSILDSKSGVYAKPFFMLNTSMAVRAFGDLCNDKQTTLSAHPEDYTLYHIGEYDDGVASLKSIVPQPIANAASLIRYNNQPELPKKLIDGLKKAIDESPKRSDGKPDQRRLPKIDKVQEALS